MRKVLAGVGISLAVASLLLAAAGRPAQAEDGSDSGGIARKLDEIAKDQKDILAGIEELKEELSVVKIRVTQNQ